MISDKRTQDKLYNSHPGYGFILCKTEGEAGEGALKEVEFNQGKDGKFRTFGNVELPGLSKLFNIKE